MKQLARWIGLGHTEHERVGRLLSTYMDGRLSGAEHALVDRHLRDCARCRAELAALRATVQAIKALPAVRVPRSFALPRRLARQPRPSWTFPIFRTATVTATAALVLVVTADLAVLPASQPRPAAPATVAVIAYEHVASELSGASAVPSEKASASSPPQVTAVVQRETAGASTPLQVTDAVLSEMAGASLPATEAPSLSAPSPAAAIPEEMPMGLGLGAGGEAAGMGGGPDDARTGVPDEAAAPTLVANTALPTAELPPSSLTELPTLVARDTASTPQAVAAQSRELPPAASPEPNVVAQYAAGRMRAIEIALASLALVSGALTLVSSGRLRRR
ncbi:MAG: zf-HC2 domain-containing protein [Thermoflexales bacterium]|nr:zf-HC2 domain-containing protein [Thermoflexales bacterium]